MVVNPTAAAIEKPSVRIATAGTTCSVAIYFEITSAGHQTAIVLGFHVKPAGVKDNIAMSFKIASADG